MSKKYLTVTVALYCLFSVVAANAALPKLNKSAEAKKITKAEVEIDNSSIAKACGIKEIKKGFPINGEIAQDNLRLRSWPWGAVIGMYPKGTKLKVLGESGEFYLVEFNGQQGYMCKNYISTDKEQASMKTPSYPGNTREGGYLMLKEGIEASKNGVKIVNNSSSSSSSSSTLGNTQAKEFYELGNRAYEEGGALTPGCARAEWISKVGPIVKRTNTYGMKKSLIIAQIINESGWMSSKASSLSNYNNVLGINTDMGRIKPSMQTSTWSKKRTSGNNNVTQWDSSGNVIGTNESMRHYDSIEECIEDYAEVLSLYHPECKGNNNIEAYRSFLEGYTPDPNGSITDRYKSIISKYNLEQYDE